MSRLQLASALHHHAGAPARSRDLSTASTIDGATKMPKFAETLSLRDRKDAIDPGPLLRNVVAFRRSAKVQIQALNSLEKVARKAASGDEDAAETLSALIPIATLLQPAAAQVLTPEVAPKPVSTPDVPAATSAATSASTAEPEPEAKKPLTRTDKAVKFGDQFDKILKPLDYCLKFLSAAAAILTIGNDLGF
jgi:hypothetical protein